MAKQNMRGKPAGNTSNVKGKNKKASTETLSASKIRKTADISSSCLSIYLSSLNVDELVEELDAYLAGKLAPINSSPSNNCNENSLGPNTSLLPKQLIETLARRTGSTLFERKQMQVEEKKSSANDAQQHLGMRKNSRNSDSKSLDKHRSKTVKQCGTDATVSAAIEPTSIKATVTKKQASLLHNYLSVKITQSTSVDKENSHAHSNTNVGSSYPGHLDFGGSKNKKQCHANSSARNTRLKGVGVCPSNLSVTLIKASASVNKNTASPSKRLDNSVSELSEKGSLLRPIISCQAPSSKTRRKENKRVWFLDDLVHFEQKCPITAIKSICEHSDGTSVASTKPTSDLAKIAPAISTVLREIKSPSSHPDAANFPSLPQICGYNNDDKNANLEDGGQFCDSSSNLSTPVTSKPMGATVSRGVDLERCKAPVRCVLEEPPASLKEDTIRTYCSVENERTDTLPCHSSRLESRRINPSSRVVAPVDNSKFSSSNLILKSNQTSTGFLHRYIKSDNVHFPGKSALPVEHSFVSAENCGTEGKNTASSTGELRRFIPGSSAQTDAECQDPVPSTESGRSVSGHGRYPVKRCLHFSEDVTCKKGFNEISNQDGSVLSSLGSDLELLDVGVVPCGAQVSSTEDETKICSVAVALSSQLKTCTNIPSSVVNVLAPSMIRSLVSSSVGGTTKVTNCIVPTFPSLQKASVIGILCDEPENAPSSSCAPTTGAASPTLTTSSIISCVAPSAQAFIHSPSTSLSTDSNCFPGTSTSSPVISIISSLRAEAVVTSSSTTTSICPPSPIAFSPTKTLVSAPSIVSTSVPLVLNSSDGKTSLLSHTTSSSKPANTVLSQGKHSMPRGPHAFNKYCLCSLPLMCQGIETGPFPSLTRKIAVADSQVCSSTAREVVLLPHNGSIQESFPSEVKQYDVTSTKDSSWSNTCNSLSVNQPEQVKPCQKITEQTQAAFSQHTCLRQHPPVATLTCNLSLGEYQTSIPESSCYESDGSSSSSFTVGKEKIDKEMVVRQYSDHITPSNSKRSRFISTSTDVPPDKLEARNTRNAYRISNVPEKFLVSVLKGSEQYNKMHAPVDAVYLQDSGSMGSATRDIFQYHMTGHQQSGVAGGGEHSSVKLSLSPPSSEELSLGLNKCEGDRICGHEVIDDGASLDLGGDCSKPAEERGTATARKQRICNERETCSASASCGNLGGVLAKIPDCIEHAMRNECGFGSDPFKKPFPVATSKRKCRQENLSFANEETNTSNDNKHQKDVTDTYRKLRYTSVMSNSPCRLTTQGNVTCPRSASALHTVQSSRETGVETQELFRTQRSPLSLASPIASSLQQTPLPPASPIASSLQRTPLPPASPIARSLQRTPLPPASPIASSLQRTPLPPASPIASSLQRTPLPPASPIARSLQRTPLPSASPIASFLLGNSLGDKLLDPSSNETLHSAVTSSTGSRVTKPDEIPLGKGPEDFAEGCSSDKNQEIYQFCTKTKKSPFPSKIPVASGRRESKNDFSNNITEVVEQNINCTVGHNCVDATVCSVISSNSDKQATPRKVNNTEDFVKELPEIDWSEMSDSLLCDPVLATPLNNSPKVRCTPSKSTSTAQNQPRSRLLVEASSSIPWARYGNRTKKIRHVVSSAPRVSRTAPDCSCQSCSQYQHLASSFLSRVFHKVLQSCKRPSPVAASRLNNFVTPTCIDSIRDEVQMSHGPIEVSTRQRSQSKCRRRLAFVGSDSSSSCNYNSFRKRANTAGDRIGRDGTSSVQQVASQSGDPSSGRLIALHGEFVPRKKNVAYSLCCEPRGEPMEQMNTSDSIDEIF